MSSADEQLEENAKESLDESKGETEVSSSPDGDNDTSISPDRGNDSITESTEQGGVVETKGDDQSPGKNVSQNGTDGEEGKTKDDTASEGTADSRPDVHNEDSVKVLYGLIYICGFTV